MAKAVLVMDMPKRCDKCNLFLMIKQKNLGVCIAGPLMGEKILNIIQSMKSHGDRIFVRYGNCQSRSITTMNMMNTRMDGMQDGMPVWVK